MDEFWVSLCEALVCIVPDVSDVASNHESLQQAATFLHAQVLALPLGLRFGTHAGLLALRAYTWLISLRPFCRLSLSRRVAIARQWSLAPLPPARQLFRALRNIAVLAYFDGHATARTAATEPSHHRTLPADITTGVLVVGSGAGGAVTALELASHGSEVLIVEEGHQQRASAPDPGTTESIGALYRQRGMTPILGRVPIAYVEGCCVGGSTELNSGFWHRPPAETLLRWKSRYDLDAASPTELCAHWQWAEQALGVRTHDGELPLSSTIFARGADAMNWSVQEVPRTAGRARSGQTPDEGEPAAGGVGRTLIPRAVQAGATLLTGYRVDRLEMSGTRATAAILRAMPGTDGPAQVRVRAEQVFVCAGATETPSLLRRSGVLRNVGDSLRIHPMLKVAARFPDRFSHADAGMSLLQVKEFWPEIVLGGSYFSRGHLAGILSNNWFDVYDRLDESDHMACYYIGVRGTGRGSVRPSYLENGRTHVHYELSDEDMWNLSRGLARLSSLLLHGGATEVLPAVTGVPAITSDVEAVRWLDDRLDGRSCSLATVHAFSSCPIGENIERTAANSFGKLHGLDNVYINDASMIPDSPGVNPQGTIMSLARRNVLHFCDEQRH